MTPVASSDEQAIGGAPFETKYSFTVITFKKSVSDLFWSETEISPEISRQKCHKVDDLQVSRR